MRRVCFAVFAALTLAALLTPPALGTSGYSSYVSMNVGTIAPGGKGVVTYHISSPQYGCPTGNPVRFTFDATVFSDGTPVGGTDCTATATYVIPTSTQCGGHQFSAVLHNPGDSTGSSDVAPATILVEISCPNTPGGIVWGAQHGTALLHHTAAIDAPRVPVGSRVRYYWKVGGVYSTDTTSRMTFPWATVGKSVTAMVRVDEGSFTYWHAYPYGTVRA